MDVEAYVRTAAELVRLNLPEERVPEIAEAFRLVMTLGKPALDCAVTLDDEPAPIFQP